MPQAAIKNFDLFRKVNVAVQYNGRLADWTTFRLGGLCPAVLHCSTPRQLDFVVRHLVKENHPFILIGGGSNLVVSDQGVPCAVIRYFSEEPLIRKEGSELLVAASTKLDDLARYAAEHGYFGMNCCSGIPGTVGGAIIGNAGAFGQSVADYLKSVFLISRQGETREVPAEDLGFAYRYSNLREKGDIVVSARFKIVAGDKQKLLAERREILDIRHIKHPDLRTHPCAGSFFRNIEPTSKAGRRQAAGWFLEQAGAKQLRCGGAAVYDKHANIIVKTDGCSSQDVYDLSQLMARLAKKVFQLDLNREVKFVGEFSGEPDTGHDMIW